MSSAQVAKPAIDIEALLAGIPGGDPAGEDIRDDVLVDMIREARREEDSLPLGVWQSDRKRVDWAEVIRLSTDILTARSKDAQVACWLCEALVGRYGLQGITPGATLLARLVSTYGPNLYPRQDEDGDRARLAMLFEWFSKRLVVMVLTLPITNPPGDRDSGLTFGDFLNCQRLVALSPSGDNKSSSKKPPPGPAPVTLQLFNATVRGTATPFYRDLYITLRAAMLALDGLKAALDAEMGREAPSMQDLAQRLGGMCQWTQTVLRERGEDPAMIDEEQQPSQEEEVVVEQDDEAPEGSHVPSAAGPIASRRDAYRQLAEIADFLARTEPHSPTPYILQRIVQWRDLPLPALLGELSRGRKDVAAIFELVGAPGETG